MTFMSQNASYLVFIFLDQLATLYITNLCLLQKYSLHLASRIPQISGLTQRSAYSFSGSLFFYLFFRFFLIYAVLQYSMVLFLSCVFLATLNHLVTSSCPVALKNIYIFITLKHISLLYSYTMKIIFTYLTTYLIAEYLLEFSHLACPKYNSSYKMYPSPNHLSKRQLCSSTSLPQNKSFEIILDIFLYFVFPHI